MSIQQSLNALIGATAGFATTGAFMYGQSDAAKARAAEKKAQKYEAEAGKAYERYLELEGQDPTAELYEKSRQLEELAYETSPTAKRASRYLDIQDERREEAEEVSMKQERQAKAERDAEESLMTRAKILGITAEQLKHRQEFLKNKQKGGTT